MFIKQIAVATLASAVLANAQLRGERRRRLSYVRIAGYGPGSKVTDHNAIDLDQAAMEGQLSKKNDDGFEVAKAIYEQGAHSKSYALVELVGNNGLSKDLKKGTAVKGTGDLGGTITGKLYSNYSEGDKIIKVQYDTTDDQDSYVGCQVGALPLAGVGLENTGGCFKKVGVLQISGKKYGYFYEPLEDNNNGRTLQGFSTGAEGKMYNNCPGCPYPDYEKFYDYYGSFTYADDIVQAAFAGTETDFKNGNADMSLYGFVGREQMIKKGTAYMHAHMYAIREFEDALDDCTIDCISCNDDPVHAWDEGVAFYTGSKEGTDGQGDGKLSYALADKRCANYKTCGSSGDELSGTSKVNFDLFDLFSLGKNQIQNGNCKGARITKERISELIYIPMIQGTLRYAYKVGNQGGEEKEEAEGAIFAAAVLPVIHAASKSAASTIYDNMKVKGDGKYEADFKDVRDAFRSVYEDIGVTCAQVGGLWDKGSGGYYEDAEPCLDASTASKPSNPFGGSAGC
jgi:hypothetical protein